MRWVHTCSTLVLELILNHLYDCYAFVFPKLQMHHITSQRPWTLNQRSKVPAACYCLPEKPNFCLVRPTAYAIRILDNAAKIANASNDLKLTLRRIKDQKNFVDTILIQENQMLFVFIFDWDTGGDTVTKNCKMHRMTSYWPPIFNCQNVMYTLNAFFRWPK